jgi:hypothetical protein
VATSSLRIFLYEMTSSTNDRRLLDAPENRPQLLKLARTGSAPPQGSKTGSTGRLSFSIATRVFISTHVIVPDSVRLQNTSFVPSGALP